MMALRIAGVLLTVLLAWTALAQVPMTGAGVPKPAGGAGGYAGPGDTSVVGAAVAWWATFSCYNAAYSGHVMDVGTSTVLPATGSRIDCSGGTAAAIGGSTCTFVSGNACSPLATTCASSCLVVEMYDQSGSNSCSSNPCHLVPTGAVAPTLTTGVLNATFPCLTSASANNSLGASHSLTQGQPFTLAMVAERISGTADAYADIRDTAAAGGVVRFGPLNSANKAFIYEGNSIPSATASDAHYHALVGVYNNASSAIYVDGSGTTSLGLGGTAGFSTAPALLVAGSNTTSVVVCEAGIWNGDIGATKASNYSTNAVARYGTLP